LVAESRLSTKQEACTLFVCLNENKVTLCFHFIKLVETICATFRCNTWSKFCCRSQQFYRTFSLLRWMQQRLKRS